MESLLRGIPLFSALPAEEIQLLAGVLQRRMLEAGSVLFREGDPGDRFTIVLEGNIEIIKAFETPEERILSIVGPGAFLGEMSLLYQDKLRSATARTRTAVDLLELNSQDFEALLGRQPTLAVKILRDLSLRLRNSENLTIRDLQEKNRQLTQAYLDLKAAQAQLLEKEKMEQELRLARKIQESILPKAFPELPGWRLSAYWQPAREVSGDFYDFINFKQNRLGLIFGDVTDKGMPAALVMATTRSLLRFAALDASSHGEVSPGEILGKVNELLCPDIPANMFVTCLFLVFDVNSGDFVFANAGQTLPCQRTAGGIFEMRARGMPLGLLPGMEYEEVSGNLAVGESVFLYSDGLVEAHDPQREMFGTPRLLSELCDHTGGKSSIDFLLGRLAEFTGADWEQEDDITFVIIEHLNKTPVY
jgi:serine phosphatase RsbU (regulator of sigma subunit)